MIKDKDRVEESMADDASSLDVVSEVQRDKPRVGKRPARQALVHLVIWIFMTVIAGIMLSKGTQKDGFVLAVLVYLFITFRLLAQHVSISQLVYQPIGKGMNKVYSVFDACLPSKFRMPVLGALVPLIVVALVSGLSPETKYGHFTARLQSLFGILVFIALLYATSNNRSAVPWRTVLPGMVIQFIIALFVLKTQAGVVIFSYISKLITNFLETSSVGYIFLFGEPKEMNFVIAVFPAIVFFCSFISIVYYFGGMQYIISKMAWLMVRLMDTSGGESVVAAASPFVGQGESALLVKPFVEYMTKSELHSTMTSGFSTIAGSVLLAYVNLVNDTSSILTACIMSIPTSLAVSKIRYPETEESITKGKVKIPATDEKEANFLHAAGNGAAMGVQLILLIGGSLLAIVSLFACADYLFGWFFYMLDVYDTFNGPDKEGNPVRVSIKLALSFVFFPIAWCIGIPLKDCRKAAEFMSLKMVVNEFLAYKSLHDFVTVDAVGVFDERTIKLLAFALCGFANVASIGIQIGCLGAMAPTRGHDLAKLAFSAMITGTVSTWLCAAAAGTLI